MAPQLIFDIFLPNYYFLSNPSLRALENVVRMCFGVGVQPGYEGAIETFRSSYMSLNLTITPKVIYIIISSDTSQKYILFSFVGSYCFRAYQGISWPYKCQRWLSWCWYVLIIILVHRLFHILYLGLWYYSEQAFESMHSDIKVRMKN